MHLFGSSDSRQFANPQALELYGRALALQTKITRGRFAIRATGNFHTIALHPYLTVDGALFLRSDTHLYRIEKP